NPNVQANVGITVNQVIDTKLGDISACFGVPFHLNPGESRTRAPANAGCDVLKHTWGTSDLDPITHAVHNVATVNGVGDFSTGNVTDSDFADAFVKSIGIFCTKNVSSPDDVDGGVGGPNHVRLPGDGNSHNVTYTITLNNTNDVAVIVHVSD